MQLTRYPVTGHPAVYRGYGAISPTSIKPLAASVNPSALVPGQAGFPTWGYVALGAVGVGAIWYFFLRSPA